MRSLHRLLIAGALAVLAASAVLAAFEVTSRPTRRETPAAPIEQLVADYSAGTSARAPGASVAR